MALRTTPLLLCSALLVACSGNPVVNGNVIPDASADVTPDVAQDIPQDISLDAPVDVTPDVTPDVAPDVTPDVTPDVPVDTGPPPCRADSDCAGNAMGEACDTTSGRCVRCTPASDRCPAGQYCVEGMNACAPGCRNDAACATTADGGMAREARCNPTTRACVECVTDDHCAAGNLCVGNACVPGCSATRGCPTGRSCCEGACVDPQTSIAHCGACGTRCTVAGGAAVCMNGACGVGMCTAPNANCDGDASNGCETDTRTSLAHCGGCGMACATRPNTAATCMGGACSYTCNPGFSDCDGDPSNGCEVDTRTSTSHCGACGARCNPPNATAACTAGVCAVAACSDGFGDCDGNPTNGCETDTRITVSNCGMCGRACSGAPNAVAVCALGSCALTCTAGFADCDGVASNGCEVDTRTSASHCGGCGRTCTLPNAASASCVASLCAVTTCAANFADCDGNAANGCEVDTRASASHCGACGRACSLPNAATTTCAASTCGVGTCATNFGNCDGMAANGCETDLRTTTANCGACGFACSGGTTCVAGACTPLASCAAILARFPTATSGTYSIDPDGTGAAFGTIPVYCDMSTDGGGWTMVYKLTSGVAGEPSRLWNGAAVNDDAAAYLNIGRNTGHFVSRLLGGWNTTVPVTQVRVAVYNGTTEGAFLRFNGTGTNRTNWFTLARVQTATWTDLVAQGQNFFQIEGLGNYGRHWFINRNYGGCPSDTGWLVVNGSSEITCDWATRAAQVNIEFARGTVTRNWNDYTNIGLADTMAVFIR